MAEILSNQAHVSFTYAGTNVPKTNDSNIVNSTMRSRYDFTVEKTTTADCFRPNDNITYTIHITNTGCRCLGRFEICDNLGGEDYMTFVEGSARLFADGSMTTIVPTGLSPLEFEIESRIDRNEELILQYTVLVNPEISGEVDSIVNEVKVRACPCECENDCGCEENRGENRNCVTKTATHTIPKCEFAEVLITKAVTNDNVCCDEELDYVITLTNTGNVDALNVIVTDSLPEEFTLMSVRMENNGDFYTFNPSEYDLSAENFLTLPNLTGRSILVPSIAPGVDNTTRIRIHGHM